MNKRVGVVGAGVGGLATAARLSYLGYDVEVFEKLTALAPHASVLRLEESGHLGFIEEQDLVVRAFEEMIGHNRDRGD